jgi:hypothetical protein
VTFDAVPVVFWLSVGISAATTVRNVGVPAEPLGAAKNVLAVCDAKLDGVTASVPPRITVPDDVMGPPVKVNPLTVPAVPTDVTVPPLDGDVLATVKFGYVPVTEIPDPDEMATT